jgi:hypothetical protein
MSFILMLASGERLLPSEFRLGQHATAVPGLHRLDSQQPSEPQHLAAQVEVLR